MIMRVQKVKPVLFLAVLFFASSALLFCSNEACAEEEGNWRFDLAPMYLWAANLDGDVVLRRKEASVKLDFNDIFDNLETVFTARFEAWYKNRWGIFFDYNYLSISGEQDTPFPKNIKVDMICSFFNLAVGYRVLSGTHSLDAMAGLRYTFLDMEVTFLRDPQKPVDKESWADPIFGLRYRWQMSDKWSVTLYGDAGGLANADLTWQGLGLVTFQPWKHVSFGVGYRALYWDYKTGSGIDRFEWDTTMYGPIIGINFNW
jgi:hypothetical protein